MNLQRLCWRRSLASPLSQYTRHNSSQSARLSLPRLTHSRETEEQLREEGVRGLYQPFGFQIAWTDWQEWTIKELNKRVPGTELTGKPDKLLENIMLKYAKDPNNAAIFNHASMAFNNQFYFQGIDLTGTEPSAPSKLLSQRIAEQFGSLDNLKAEFLANAKVMYGPGFVWLVSHKNNLGERKLSILRTYLAGSPLGSLHWRRQSQDATTENLQTFASASLSYDRFSRKFQPSDATLDVTPLLCVSTWEHSFMFDWKVSGKEQFLEAWWNKIDWHRVQTLSEIELLTPVNQNQPQRGYSPTGRKY